MNVIDLSSPQAQNPRAFDKRNNRRVIRLLHKRRIHVLAEPDDFGK